MPLKHIECDKCEDCGLWFEFTLKDCPWCGTVRSLRTMQENISELQEECKGLRNALATETANANRYAHERDQAKQRLKTIYEMLKSWALG